MDAPPPETKPELKEDTAVPTPDKGLMTGREEGG